jgi:hypothetical protein
VAPLRDLGGVAVKELTGWYVSPSGTDLAMRCCCMKARLLRTNHVYRTAPRVQRTGGVRSAHTHTHTQVKWRSSCLARLGGLRN